MICSHNTFTYLKPTKWWMYFLLPFSRCQTRNIKKQFPVDVVDIRVRLVKGEWMVCHGIITYSKFIDIINLLNDLKITKLRLLLEGSYTKDDALSLEDYLKHNYKGSVYEFRDKKSWKQVLDYPTIPLTQLVGSVQSDYGKAIPLLYHLLHPHKDKRKEALTSDIIYSFDFI